jgi:hypothetical protein
VYSQWSFAELQALISYKAALAGSLALKVDADYTRLDQDGMFVTHPFHRKVMDAI